jgi:hypothetical protein
MEPDGSLGTSRSADSAASGSGSGDAAGGSHNECSSRQDRRHRMSRMSRYSIDSSASGGDGGDEVLGRLLKDILRHKAKEFNGREADARAPMKSARTRCQRTYAPRGVGLPRSVAWDGLLALVGHCLPRAVPLTPFSLVVVFPFDDDLSLALFLHRLPAARSAHLA